MDFSGFSLCVTMMMMMMILGLSGDAFVGFVESKELAKHGGLEKNQGHVNNGWIIARHKEIEKKRRLDEREKEKEKNEILEKKRRLEKEIKKLEEKQRLAKEKENKKLEEQRLKKQKEEEEKQRLKKQKEIEKIQRKENEKKQRQREENEKKQREENEKKQRQENEKKQREENEKKQRRREENEKKQRQENEKKQREENEKKQRKENEKKGHPKQPKKDPKNGGFGRNYISWDDMKVDQSILNTRNDPSGSRIIVVDKNGNGDSSTVQGAVNMVPHYNNQRVKIYIRPGVYREKVHVPPTKPYISFIGNGKQSSETVITWGDKAGTRNPRTGNELGTSNSASVFIESDYFTATGITIENSYVATRINEVGSQAVALRVKAENAMFYKVRILGVQDTLLDDRGKHYFLDCYIQGSVDFICGAGTSLFKNCVIHSTARQYGSIAAHKRESPHENSGFSFVNCTITGTGKILLGRPWGEYSRTMYSYCHIHDIIAPAGWSDWNQPHRQRTAVFGEYRNTGRGADRSGRAPWSKSLSDAEVWPFLDIQYINGQQWLKL